ncbi:MAG: toxin-antitoxin system YwqK family antitoxin [Bacteroidia bacterium]
MKFLIIFLFFFCAISVKGQQDGFNNKAEAKNVMVNGLKEGKWMEYIDSTEKISTNSKSPYYRLTIYKNGQPVGKVREYYNSGKLKFEKPYLEGMLNGLEKDYYENGNLKRETYYKNGNANGVEKDYYKNGKLWYETVFKDDVPGITTVYDTNGKVTNRLYNEDGKEIK